MDQHTTTRRRTGRPKGSRTISDGQRAIVRAVRDLGGTKREAAAQAGIGATSAWRAMHDDTIDQAMVERCKTDLLSRYLVAGGLFLDRAVGQIDNLSGYQAMICSGISHDHYLRGLRGELPGLAIQINIPGCQATISSGSGDGARDAGQSPPPDGA